ncbi:MAG: hypothetical protein K8J08_16270 [Thermoanaerobaculia bacterium]|nr:hypothetical protein [Thermoanaerobaculia bacterium]
MIQTSRRGQTQPSGQRLVSRLSRPLVWCLPLMLLVGCGYALVGKGGNNIPEHVQRVYIAPLVNDTARAEVDQLLTRAITEEFVTRKRFEIVSSPEQADGVLDGAVLLFSTTPVLFDDEGRGTEYQLTINVRMKFHDRVEDRTLWSNDRYVYKETYESDSSDSNFVDLANVAIEEAAARFARTVVIDLLEGF